MRHGQAIALHPGLRGGSKLAIAYTSSVKGAEEALEKIRGLGVKDVIAIQADILDPEFASKVLLDALDKLNTKTVDILVNNAVLNDPAQALQAQDITLENFVEVMHGNVYAPVSLITKVLPHLPEYGDRIINISSVSAYMANPNPAMIYGASKATLQAYTRSSETAFGKGKRATFNSVVVGATATDFFEAAREVAGMAVEFVDSQIQAITTANRIGVPEHIAYIVGFLAREEGRWVNGAALSANGGTTAVLPAMG
ncbi:hypothetical protein F53441_9680 [Fusarium austroafricanum]|uniref:Uncharacterized protein n=1 Tax=Fusarium austroafricanum TaxID=2364996 RepID=A0A8H4NW66_9HYPO|nr:hypothetical protein F53441_9680 [Fusarium austroafricanum]